MTDLGQSNFLNVQSPEFYPSQLVTPNNPYGWSAPEVWFREYGNHYSNEEPLYQHDPFSYAQPPVVPSVNSFSAVSSFYFQQLQGKFSEQTPSTPEQVPAAPKEDKSIPFVRNIINRENERPLQYEGESNSRIAAKQLLERAEDAKRANDLDLAGSYYRKALRECPWMWQGWLDYAKMEEEFGKVNRCQEILLCGLTYCPYNEPLLMRAMKLEEKIGNLTKARSLLARLEDVSPEKGWRMMLEGAELEARNGETQVARRIYKYLMTNVPNYGNVFQEACLLEERCNHIDRAITLARRGIAGNPKYGPLHITLIRLLQKSSMDHHDLGIARDAILSAVRSVPKELRWKIHLEEAQLEERAGNLELARRAYVRSVNVCPNNLVYKVWLSGAKTEMRLSPGRGGISDNPTAIKLLNRSLEDVPHRKKAQVLLDWARMEQVFQCMKSARDILTRAREENPNEWKLYLEAILLETRCHNIKEAIKLAHEALEIHVGTGRLWQVLVGLYKEIGEEAQWKTFQEAVLQVPKSGEVWCEGARILMSKGDYAEARRYLEFSLFFTPQYGDSFLEYLRLELLENGPNVDLSTLERMCCNAEPNYGALWLYCKDGPLTSAQEAFQKGRRMMTDYITSHEAHMPQAFVSCGPVERVVLPLDCLGQHDTRHLSIDDQWHHIFGYQ
ncbi:hypothetical protein PROFUN_08372 [Planoprotostelium fungivorum]|uniref:Uncharacterized protein n=1 Tax=Planoprotostelium fungivorum TaxID=1890364 RepID=A0A2P6NCT2_9EUKA|nr:hypothetical protein PROFUN_10639 [Planoprotostelium fungivorum]PRP84172.1 hypothetical protein PROFUN_08372 [Planoprotostelium fungivorum]